MSYLVFARKFRPQTFEDVVGQEPIVTTLKNAISQKRIPQSFIFSGPRGVGKTSTARILAKALNCQKGPTTTPCEKCISCTEIQQGNSLDVLEIDGASNRGIDEIRSLRETVKFKPVNGRTKIYIIDEVHMLTQEAFNALLKTLEEPPEHVKFIFATTELHKVPLTILSRCQRFHFRRIPVSNIVAKLEEIVKKEKMTCERPALFLIAKASEGGLRDAESLLDQLASFTGGEVKATDVTKLLGWASDEKFLNLLEALIQKKPEQVFSLVKELDEQGADFAQFASSLLDIFRSLLVLQISPVSAKSLELEETMETFLAQKSKEFSKAELMLALSLFQNLLNQFRRNLASPRILLEAMLIKLMSLEELKPIDALLSPSPSVSAPPSSPGGIGFKSSVPAEKIMRSSASQPVVEKKVQNQAAASVKATTVISSGMAGASEWWPRIVEYVKGKKMSSGIFLSESSPVEMTDEKLVLCFPTDLQFHKDMLDKEPNRRLVEEALEAVTGQSRRIQFTVGSFSAKAAASCLSAPSEKPAPTNHVNSDEKLPDIITQALDVFTGAKIIRRES